MRIDQIKQCRLQSSSLKPGATYNYAAPASHPSIRASPGAIEVRRLYHKLAGREVFPLRLADVTQRTAKRALRDVTNSGALACIVLLVA